MPTGRHASPQRTGRGARSWTAASHQPFKPPEHCLRGAARTQAPSPPLRGPAALTFRNTAAPPRTIAGATASARARPAVGDQGHAGAEAAHPEAQGESKPQPQAPGGESRGKAQGLGCQASSAYGNEQPPNSRPATGEAEPPLARLRMGGAAAGGLELLGMVQPRSGVVSGL